MVDSWRFQSLITVDTRDGLSAESFEAMDCRTGDGGGVGGWRSDDGYLEGTMDCCASEGGEVTGC